jgi:hypothetical protein
MITGKKTTIFNDLDLLNENTEAEVRQLYSPVFKDLQFYRAFNKSMQNGLFYSTAHAKK